MSSSSQRTHRIGQIMKASLSREVRAGQRLTGSAVRVAALLATRGVPTVGRGAGHFAREAVEGAVNAVGEISGETTSFVRDTVIGVIEGTEQIVSVTAPAIKEVVSGAISGGREVSENVVEVGQSAVGVATGIAAAGGDMSGAIRDSADQLVTQAGRHERSGEEIAAMAGEVVHVVAEEAHRTADTSSEVDALVSLAAISALESAYRVSPFHAATVREELARSVAAARPSLAPEVRQQLSQVGEKLAVELPRTRGTWRGKALFVAVRTLWGAGVTDLAASLAYFTVLSFFPLVAMIILAFAAVADTGTARQALNGLLVYYFPASAGLFQESVELLINNSAALGLIALAGVLIAANGLFLAANRSVNRVFGVNSPRSFRGNLADAFISAALGIV
ncbi:MAG: YihY/virulence factor BrkB family protein, partial [Chloroflexota bacterium]|nr:YihY/virulence factor BrkB family protein [Chloroflexota bacterium]